MEIVMRVEVPDYIYSQFIRYDNIDAVIDSGNIVLHEVKIVLKSL